MRCPLKRAVTNIRGADRSLFSPSQLFKKALEILSSGDFLGEVSCEKPPLRLQRVLTLTRTPVYSVQAIVISTEVAHNLGFSQLNATLMSAAIRIAQCIGLHKIRDYKLPIETSRDQWNELVALETGKRVWYQMVVQDHFAIPFNDSYGTVPSRFTVS